MSKIKDFFRKVKLKISKDMETKTSKRNKLLIEEYDKGRILQVDNNEDNKEFLKAR